LLLFPFYFARIWKGQQISKLPNGKGYFPKSKQRPQSESKQKLEAQIGADIVLELWPRLWCEKEELREKIVYGGRRGWRL
jgi:hypothetical protein